MKHVSTAMALIALCSACSQEERAEKSENAVEAGNLVNAMEPDATQPAEPVGLPDDGKLVSEGPIDPNSAQGAGQVLQSYAALLEQKRLVEARRLWTEGGSGSSLSPEAFEEAFSRYADIHAEIGAPGRVEGAAGSAYAEVPLRFYGTLKGGQSFSSAGTATLRRVNDVPGSTGEQRRWHIYRIDVKPPL